MKHFLVVFTLVFLCVILAVTAGFIVYSKVAKPFDDTGQEVTKDFTIDDENPDNTGKNNNGNDDAQSKKTPLEKAFEESNRVNFLIMGLEGVRTDTIIFASYDPDNNKADLISIPRDTYFQRGGKEEYNHAGERKVNAVYGDNGTQGLRDVVSHLLEGVPIDYYVKLKYKGVERIVDILDGVEVNVPFPMKYDDPYDTPPLHIDIPAGIQVLSGENAVKFLRYRSGYSDGDLGRINAQQQFIKSAIKKSMSTKILTVIRTAFNYVNTDMTISEAGTYAVEVVKMDLGKDLSMITLPGHEEKRTFGGQTLSYYLHDPQQVEELLMKIYNATDTNQ